MRWLAILAFVSCGVGCGAADPGPTPTEPQGEPRTEAPTEPRESAPPTEAVAPEEAAPVAPSIPGPVLAGPCASDADCGFDSPCLPRACVSNPPVLDACDESSPPPGVCACVNGRCGLNPFAQRGEVTSDEACESFGERACGLDLARGTCAPGRPDEGVGGAPYTGPQCFCDGHPPRRCHFRWFEPVACRSTDDCWAEHDPLPHPIARPRRLRGRRFRPCVDGELAPTCAEGHCFLIPYGC